MRGDVKTSLWISGRLLRPRPLVHRHCYYARLRVDAWHTQSLPIHTPNRRESGITPLCDCPNNGVHPKDLVILTESLRRAVEVSGT